MHVDLVAGTARLVARPADFEEVAGVVAARDAQVAVVFGADARALIVHPPSLESDGATPGLVEAWVPRDVVRGALKAALSPDGAWLYLASEGALTRIDLGAHGSGARAELVVSLPGEATALAIVGDEALLVGMANGDVLRHDLGTSGTRPVVRLAAAPVALSGSGSGGGPFLLAAATADRRLWLADAGGVVEHGLGSPAARVSLLPHRPCLRNHVDFAADPDAPGLGQSIAVLFENGGFDVFGLPDPAAPRAFAPMSILDGRLLGRPEEQRVLGFGLLSRRLALFSGDRLSIRTLAYLPPPAGEPADGGTMSRWAVPK